MHTRIKWPFPFVFWRDLLIILSVGDPFLYVIQFLSIEMRHESEELQVEGEEKTYKIIRNHSSLCRVFHRSLNAIIRRKLNLVCLTPMIPQFHHLAHHQVESQKYIHLDSNVQDQIMTLMPKVMFQYGTK